MNALDKLYEKKRTHGERLTTAERIILACPDPRLMLEAATELAALYTATSALAGLVSRAMAAGRGTIQASEIEAIADELVTEMARAKDHSSIKHR